MDTTEAHRQQLAQEHARLEKALAEELTHWAPNHSLISTLKKQKLRIKEQLAGIMETS